LWIEIKPDDHLSIEMHLGGGHADASHLTRQPAASHGEGSGALMSATAAGCATRLDNLFAAWLSAELRSAPGSYITTTRTDCPGRNELCAGKVIV
jgi:hypothetical protein